MHVFALIALECSKLPSGYHLFVAETQALYYYLSMLLIAVLYALSLPLCGTNLGFGGILKTLFCGFDSFTVNNPS